MVGCHGHGKLANEYVYLRKYLLVLTSRRPRVHCGEMKAANKAAIEHEHHGAVISSPAASSAGNVMYKSIGLFFAII